MAANIPDLGAVAHLGGQFHHNVFAQAQKSLNTKSKQFADAHVAQVKQTATNRQKFAQSAAQGIKQGQAAYAKNQKAQQTAAKKAAAAHAQGVKSGRVAPAQGAPPRTFAMGTTPQQKAQAKATAASAKTMQQQRNFAHGQALNYQAAQFRVQQQQRNYAHGQAIQQQKQMNKTAAKGGPVNTTSTPSVPSLTPSFSSAPQAHTPSVKPQGIPQATFSSQFKPQKPASGPQGSATASFSSGPTPSAPTTAPTRSGSVTGPQFPQHVHPEGSSTQPLANLTARQPRPNTFTTGSRNVQPGGIAARGSQLEAWAIQRQQQVRQQRGSNNTQLRLGD